MSAKQRIALKLLWMVFLTMLLVVLWQSERDFIYRAF